MSAVYPLVRAAWIKQVHAVAPLIQPAMPFSAPSEQPGGQVGLSRLDRDVELFTVGADVHPEMGRARIVVRHQARITYRGGEWWQRQSQAITDFAALAANGTALALEDGGHALRLEFDSMEIETPIPLDESEHLVMLISFVLDYREA